MRKEKEGTKSEKEVLHDVVLRLYALLGSAVSATDFRRGLLELSENLYASEESSFTEEEVRGIKRNKRKFGLLVIDDYMALRNSLPPEEREKLAEHLQKMANDRRNRETEEEQGQEALENEGRHEESKNGIQ